MRRALFLFALVAALVLSFAGVVLAQQATPDTQRGPASQGAGRYIVVLKDNAPDTRSVADEHSRRYNAQVIHEYEDALKGYAATLSDQALGAIQSDPNVRFVDRDLLVQADAVSTATGGATGVDRIEADRSPTANINGTNDTLSTPAVAIIDTGIDRNHPDLKDTSSHGTSCQSYTSDSLDDAGHGTHVAGTVAAKDDGSGVVGVAPGTPLYAAKVLNKDGSGYRSDVICGINWVAQNAQAKGIKVANVSIGGSGSDDGKNCAQTTDAYKLAYCGLKNAGVTTTVSAGNSGTNYKNQVPAAYRDKDANNAVKPLLLTVTGLADSNGQPGGSWASPSGSGCASDQEDTAYDNSNYTTVGSLDEIHTIAMPGRCILSTVPGGGTGYKTGTSMAAPHAAGTAALCIAAPSTAPNGTCSEKTPEEIIAKLRSDAKTKSDSSWATRLTSPYFGFKDDPYQPKRTRYYGYLGYVEGY